eukprot:CAMPEP_0204839672 /NCGR_PEP_ID=MMETSP1346-20131115/35110_1 /ASSEMBLY_ACC=CAM_ASM_000771 /TAXON_ID=215587 /ORGANISM="Aplanochytrium stocchinoi, Strain GSBS06" /LENGTH=85 /DNA_ID=CAMNT_0051976577 /DNA_START=1808 /DNA_END=2061 /DNA_ORIENTATION=+
MTTVALPIQTKVRSDVFGYHSFHILIENSVADELKTLASDDMREANILATIMPLKFIGTTVRTRNGYERSKSNVSASIPGKCALS